MNRKIRHIAMMILLLIAGAQNGAWADVTYHVLTLPFTTYGSTANTVKRSNIRVEAIRCTSSETTVGLPSAFQTPLMNSSAYSYYYSASNDQTTAFTTATHSGTLYGSNSTVYTYYDNDCCTANLTNIDSGVDVPDGVTDIYVIYDYDDTARAGATLSLDLSGGKMYNITMESGSTLYFYGAHYKQSWGNRTENVKASNYTGSYLDCLASNDMVKTDKDSYGRNLGWYLKGNDPYNIRLVTGYTGTLKADNRCPMKDSFVWAQVNPGAGTSQSMWLFTDTLTNYRNMMNLFVSFLLLNHNNGEDYTMIGSNLNTTSGSRTVVHPYNGKYFHLQHNTNDTGPRILPVTPANATPLQFYEVKDYTFNVTTPFYDSSGSAEDKAAHTVSATKKWSDYGLSASLTTDDVPDSLNRKYCTYSGLYKEYAHTNAISTYQDAYDNSCQIYVDYSVATSSIPFTTLAPDGSYSNATWYEMTDKDSSGKKIRWDSSSSTFKNNGGASDYEKESEFAFIGDPYELQVIHRKQSEDNTAKRYVGAASAGNLGVSASASDGFVWEIPYDAVSGNFVLREYKTIKAPSYWKWDTTEGSTITKAEEDSTRIKVMSLPTYNYTYNVVDLAGRIAVKATVEQTIFTSTALPSIIYSPFLYGETVGYYTGSYTDGSGRGKFSYLTGITEVPATNNINIWVKYTTNYLDSKAANLSQDQEFNVKLNGEYIYWENGAIKSNASPTNEQLGSQAYTWRNRGRDPYAMLIDNVGATDDAGLGSATESVTIYKPAGDGSYETQNRKKGVWVQVGDGDDWAAGTIGFTETRTSASKFVAKMSSLPGAYEVMAATGTEVDASTTYYNIGRTSTDGTKMFSNAAYETGNDEVAFVLQRSDATDVTYHLIDHSNNELLTVVNRHISTDAPQFPTDYWSPLVKEYTYYASTSDYSYTATNKTKPHTTTGSELATVGANTDIYVTYETNDLVDLSANTMYLMEFTRGTAFYAENGLDGFDTQLTEAPFYPYCNGDNNFFVYGQDQYDLQQQGAASTRTRWAWYPESDNLDPYHVKILSRQTSPYNSVDMHAYFHTYKPEGHDEVVTGLTWPGVSGVAATEYMVLGTVGQYQLVTTEGIDLNNDGDNEDDGETTRYVLNSFEQYWKTFDTIKKNLFGLTTVDQSEPSTVPATTTLEIPTTSEYYAYKDSKTLREYLTDIKGYNNYVQWAYAKRWNGYNAAGNKSKGWEEIEHWFQTIAVGSGYFNFVEMTIDPALILLDQHGWEIMRKPLPSGPDDPDKDEKYAAIRPYDSPMVESYYFWTKSSKRSGCHQYYNLGQQVTVDGEAYTSTSLTDLPPYATAANIMDSKGNLYDQYVTYVAKEEYAYSYDPASPSAGEKFLIQQGGHYVSTSDGSTISKNDVPTGGMPAAIISANATFDNAYLWYLKPNTAIDTEMGYTALNPDWTNDYASDTETRSGFNSNGFDPYNIQISNVGNSAYFTTSATGATLADGVFTGTYTSKSISLAAKATSYVTAEGHDHTRLQMTNQTFMAVQDANGNMQLMPRFDHANRMTDFDGLDDPQTNPADDESGTQSTLLFRPYIYNYIIVDNQGRESMRYQSAGELTPQTPSHFKSPLAKNYGYYNATTCVTADTVSSFTKVSLTDNTVYVRYEYDEDADNLGILKGKWLTMQLNALDAKYDSGIKNVTKPATVDNDDSAWQWKFLKNNWTTDATNYVAPDPYAVELYNRSEKDVVIPTGTRFALLSHTSGGYALAQCGTQSTTAYNFLNGDGGMNTSTAAAVTQETNFTSLSGTFNGTYSQVLLNNDVENTYTYKVITNAGAFAVQATQTYDEAYSNNFEPTLPDDAQSPLLNTDDYTYYENATVSESVYTITGSTAITTLYGLYEDYLFVRYNAYDRNNTDYKVPNKKAIVDSHVARDEDSNDATLDISGSLLYNIIWYEDNMMASSDGSTISEGLSQALTSGTSYVWTFEGEDPYALTIKHNNANKHVYSSDNATCALDANNATTFMLLNKDDYDYGILQVTGGTTMLSGYGSTLTASDPTKFIIFALSMGGVKYHLVIKNIGSTEEIPYRELAENATKFSDPYDSSTDKKTIKGSTMRALTTSTYYPTAYPIDDETVTTVSLGDKVVVPSAMRRPNCLYLYYIDGIYSDDDCTIEETGDLQTKYKGMWLKNEYLMNDAALLGKYIKINIEYQFDTGLGTNHGGDFVSSVSQNLWYTFNALGDSDPYLAQYTTAWGLKALEGLDSRYTNDYLWTPVGDPYGFQMYNRYAYKNNGVTDAVMTTTTLASDTNLGISNENSYLANSIYELLVTSTAGYFYVHPVANTDNNLFVKRDDSDNNELKLNTTGSEWTFGLDITQLKPYFDRKGYVGGLTSTAYSNNPTLVSAIESGSLTYDQLVATQKLVYDDENIVKYTPGYYRLHAQPDIPDLSSVRYASGYLHKLENDVNGNGTESDAIPMHFYSRKGVTTTFKTLDTGFTTTSATQGEIPVPATEEDPSTIFYFSGAAVNSGNPTSTMQTQGLKVYQNTMKTSSSTTFTLMDIGGAVLLIHDGAAANERMYFCFDQTTNIYDLKFKHNCPTDYAKWCMEPANNQGLVLTMNNGGDGYYYTTFCAPYDVLLPEDATVDAVDYTYKAYISTAWDSEVIYPKAIGDFNTETNGCPEDYRGNDRFIPAGTPVIIRSNKSGNVTMTIPTSGPSIVSTGCVFTGNYLEQKLAVGNEVYSFGLPFTSTLTKDADYDTTGEISAPVPTQANSGVGFYINANLNKEGGAERANWVPRNNRYVLHNKIYYRSGSSGASAPSMDRNVEFVPVKFDFDEDEEISIKSVEILADKVYDLSGRCIVSGDEVINGTWRERVAPGIYIIGGKKIVVRKY